LVSERKTQYMRPEPDTYGIDAVNNRRLKIPDRSNVHRAYAVATFPVYVAQIQ